MGTRSRRDAGCRREAGLRHWFGQYSQTHAHFYYPYYLMSNLERFPLPMNEGKKRARYAQDEIHDHALAFITAQAKARRPFLRLPSLHPAAR